MKLLITLLLVLPLSAIDISSTISKHRFSESSISLLVRDLQEDRDIIELNGDINRTPASIQKLFTTEAALIKLGLGYRFSTGVYSSSFDIESGALSGRTYIKGEGDPGLTAERIWLFATHLTQRGVKRLEDTLLIDNSFFTNQTRAPGFENRQSSRAYMAPVTALTASFNALEIAILPGRVGTNATVTILPHRDNLQVTGAVQTTSNAGRIDVSTYHNGSNTVLSLSGSIAATAPLRYFYRKVWDPGVHAASVFTTAFKQAGIEIDSTLTILLEPLPEDKPELFYSFGSGPLPLHIRSMNKYSNNYIAESIYLTLSSGDKPGSWKKSSDLMKELFSSRYNSSKIGIPTYENGSGMGGGNQATANQIGALLSSARSEVWYPEFAASLPIAGVDGTLANRLNKPPLLGQFRAKTGTLSQRGVHNLAGYYTTKSGRLYSIVLLQEETPKGAWEHWQLQEDILTEVALALEEMD